MLTKMKKLDPNIYGLKPQTKLFKNSNRDFFIVIDRKSRIIMKDGLRILKIAQKVRQKEEQKKIGLLTSAPVCSKTKSFLSINNILVESL
jgi:hypothetical protein